MLQNNSEKCKWLSAKFLSRITFAFILLIALFAWSFFWNREIYWFDENYVLDNALWGNFGDFIGGFIGSILAFIGVIITCLIFIEQSKQTINLNKGHAKIARKSQFSQKKQSEIQRFNSLFFELIELHRKQVEGLMDTSVEGFTGKIADKTNFFDRCMIELQNNFTSNNSYARANLIAKRKYLQLYLSNAAALAPYFRVLYRLFELIDKSEISEKEKVRYAKIARAQLSEGALFMLRYNSTTPYGIKFIEYINKFRLLKHLPILSLLEFKYVQQIISEGDSMYQYSLNMLFFTAWKRIYNITVGHEERTDELISLYDERKKYKFGLKMHKKYRTALYLTIDSSCQNRDPLLKCFKNFSPDKFALLLTNFLHEIYEYSNFSMYNKREIVEYKKKITNNGNLTNIVCWIKHTENKALRVSHPSRDQFYNISET